MEFRALNGTDVDQHFKRSLCSMLVKHTSEPSTEFSALIGKAKLTSFLDILPGTYSTNPSWPFTRTISVHLKDFPDQEIPSYLREYWICYVKKEIEEFAAYPNPSPYKRRWRVIDTCEPPLVSVCFQAMQGFNIYFSRSLNAFDPELLDKTDQAIIRDRVVIRNPDELGNVLNVAKQIYLRHQFYERGRTVEITIGHVSPDKSEKVFFVKVSRDHGRTSNYIVKFDHPGMIASEKDHFETVHSALKQFNRNELLPCLYKIVDMNYPPSSCDGDILGIITSEAVGPEFQPDRLTLRKVWPDVKVSQVRQFFLELEPILLLLEQVAHYENPEFKQSSLQAFYQEFFKRLYGFVLSKQYLQFQDFLPAIHKDEIRQRSEDSTLVSVRRIQLNSSKDGKLGMSIQVEDITNQRITLKFPDFANETTWPQTFAKSGLAGVDRLNLNSSSLEPDTPPWKDAVERLHSRMRLLIRRREELVEYKDLGFLESLNIAPSTINRVAVKDLPNPIWFFVRLSQDDTFCTDTAEFEWVSALIHFDLHLANILAPVKNDRTGMPTLIDLASMQRGPVEYDYARMEVRLVLDRSAEERWFDEDIGKDLKMIVDFHETVESPRSLNSLRGFRKEIQFIKDLRLRRSLVAENLNSSGRLSGVIHREDFKPMYACLFFEYLSELFFRSSHGGAVSKDLLWAFVSASYYLEMIKDYWQHKT